MATCFTSYRREMVFVASGRKRLEAATKRPLGEPLPVRYFHTSRRSLATIGDPIATGLSVSADKLVFSMTERTGNIWMTGLQ
jgi:hypothetical protein